MPTVCLSDAGLEMSGGQAALYSNLKGYLGEADGWGQSGHIMCILALCTWILTMTRELAACYKICHAVLVLPRGKRSVIQSVISIDEKSGGLTIHCVSQLQLACFISVQLARATVSVLLLYYGCLFLAYTKSTADLLLNAVRSESCIVSS